MIVLLDTPQSLDKCSEELGCKVEQLFTPLTRRAPKNESSHFAIDNGAFSSFDPNSFRNILNRHHKRADLCRWVAAPDIVGSAIRTKEVFEYWYSRIRNYGFPVAYVAQDGQESVEIPWSDIDAVFIGGSTQFKLGEHSVRIIKTAKALEKWVHAGRVNTPARFEYFEKLGVNSIDGTGLSRYSWMRKEIYLRESGLPFSDEPEDE